MAMWSVGGIAGLICIVNISAGMHLNAKEDRVHVRRECQHHVLDSDKVYYTYLGEPTSVVKKRSINQNLRIHVHYDSETIPFLPTESEDLIKKELIPKAVEYFKNTLKVRSVMTPIRLQRTCKSRMLVYVEDVPMPYCVGECDEETVCGLVKVPPEHLMECYKKQDGRLLKVGPNGAGVNTDFILYVSAGKTEKCEESLIAFATYCQLERALDRPVAGYVNICPQSLALGQAKHLRAGAISSIKHEIFHALGFSSSLFAFYRDQYGDPMSPRMPISGQPYIENQQTVWSSNLTRVIIRQDWKKVTMVVTPAVVREARRHFGCDSLEGAELEDQSGTGTVGSHWEKRVFENEAMTGSLTHNPVFSRVTLALMEDTGWYHVNYEMAEALLFGFRKGCDFVRKSCREYIHIKENAGESLSPFCDVVGEMHQNNLSCTLGRKAIASCNLQRYNDKLDYKFQPLTHINGVDAADVPKYGGSVKMADYCPYLQPFSVETMSGEIRNTQCGFQENQIDDKVNYLRELYGNNCVCLRHKGTWKLQRVGSLTKLQPRRSGAGCYKIKCGLTEREGFTVYVDDESYECHSEDIELAVSSPRSKYIHTGVIVCPAYRDVCVKPTAPQYPADRTRGKPNYMSDSGRSGVSPRCPVHWTLGLGVVVCLLLCP